MVFFSVLLGLNFMVLLVVIWIDLFVVGLWLVCVLCVVMVKVLKFDSVMLLFFCRLSWIVFSMVLMDWVVWVFVSLVFFVMVLMSCDLFMRVFFLVEVGSCEVFVVGVIVIRCMMVCGFSWLGFWWMVGCIGWWSMLLCCVSYWSYWCGLVFLC